MVIFLIGYMGCGKTTIGKGLARVKGYDFIDTDTLIESEQGCGISSIFASKGESAFRAMETEVLSNIDTSKNIIVSTGGGLPCFNDNMDVMNSLGFTIYINLKPELLKKRLLSGVNRRPLISGKSELELLSFIEENLGGREQFYSKAKMVVSGSDLKVDDIVKLMEFYNY